MSEHAPAFRFLPPEADVALKRLRQDLDQVAAGFARAAENERAMFGETDLARRITAVKQKWERLARDIEAEVKNAAAPLHT